MQCTHCTFGMFMSSMKTSSLFPGGGPKLSLVLFSTLDSSVRCTSIEDVREEKFMFSRSCWEGGWVEWRGCEGRGWSGEGVRAEGGVERV